jgi:hypothetical protein
VLWDEIRTRVCGQAECAGVLNLGAASGVALVIKCRRVIGRLEKGTAKVAGMSVSVPEIVFDGVVR